MKTKIKHSSLLALFFLATSCTKYLDVVPDNTLTLERIFEQRETAYGALGKVYAHMPWDDDAHAGFWMLGDEWLGRLDLDNRTDQLRSMRIMRGLQSQSSPQLGLWSGSGGVKSLYEGMRQADVFVANIDKVRDMTGGEKTEWKAQAKFLKAYYAFLLVRHYGPIVLPTTMATAESTKADLFRPRAKIEDCFAYIVDLMNEALPDLALRTATTELGQVNQIIAKAIIARVLFFRASPFFNGNQEYFGDFLDHDGQPFFPLAYDSEKWKQAIDALDEAIAICEQNGMGLYTYDREVYPHDYEARDDNATRLKTLYDLRLLIADPWNKELVWGYSNVKIGVQASWGSGGRNNQYSLAFASNIRLPTGYEGVTDMDRFSWNWLAATHRMAERYHTENGLPIEEDLTYDYANRNEITTTPGQTDPLYARWSGYLQPGADTIKLYMDREPRFYANLGITGGYWRAHSFRIPTMFYNGTAGGQGSTYQDDYLPTGIGVQKFVHPDSKSGEWERLVSFPYPIIRLADLYLMKAEALNEYSGPSAEVYGLINRVRARAGIPTVEAAWGNPALARMPNRHLAKDGMREIILRERSIEFAFEGIHFWDMWRHKRAPQAFSSPIWGWRPIGASGATFFSREVKQERRFTITDCLWPIDLEEMNTNGNLIQNPGW